MRDGHLDLWPPRKQPLKQLPAHLTVQLAYTVNRATSANRQISHVERFCGIVTVSAAERE
jgi:hypothetical protein